MDAAELIAHALIFLSGWTLLSFPLAVFIGRAIAVGAGDEDAHQDTSLATDPSAGRAAA